MTDFFGRARELERQGRPFVTATVVRVERPTSGRPGDRAIVTLEGKLYGWVGGSCARPTVIEQAAKALREDRSRLIRLSPQPDPEPGREGLTDLAMTCFSGGTMEIFIEPHQPKSKLAVVGDQPVAQALAKLGEALGLEVEAEFDAQKVHPLTFVVVATHGDRDEMALVEALESSAPYVGLVSSPKRAESIRDYLKTRGFTEDSLSRLRAPAGLDIQARSPEEIALSILAEIVQVRRNLGPIEWPAAVSIRPEESRTGASSADHTSLDPVCGMTVQTEGDRVTHEHGGAVYTFCCVGCREKFAADPKAYLSA